MMQGIGCKNCGNPNLGLENVWVNVTLSKATACNHCHQSHTENQDYLFCSLKCFYEYLEKYTCGADHNFEIKWEEI